MNNSMIKTETSNTLRLAQCETIKKDNTFTLVEAETREELTNKIISALPKINVSTLLFFCDFIDKTMRIRKGEKTEELKAIRVVTGETKEELINKIISALPELRVSTLRLFCGTIDKVMCEIIRKKLIQSLTNIDRKTLRAIYTFFSAVMG